MILLQFVKKKLHNFFNVIIWKLPVTYLVTVLIWGVGTIYGFSTTSVVAKISTKENLGDSADAFRWVLYITFFVSAAHQLLIFRSLHRLDHEKIDQDSFTGWFGTKWEFVIRLLAVVFLLCVGGEIPHAFENGRRLCMGETITVPDIQNPNQSTTNNSSSPNNELFKQNKNNIAISKRQADLYPRFCFLLFFDLLIWDYKGGGLKQTWAWIKKFTWKPDLPVRFFLCDFFGAVNWLLLLICLTFKQTMIIVLPLTLFVYLITILHRVIMGLLQQNTNVTTNESNSNDNITKK